MHTTFEVGEPINEIIKVLWQKASYKHIDISCMFEEGLEGNKHIRTDQRRLMQVMLNLVSNAVKFTPQNGKIDISVQILGTDESLEISVRDNGTGIKAED